MNFTWAEFPDGVLCEGCDKPFEEGDEIRTRLQAVAANGVVVLDGICPRCVLLDARAVHNRPPISGGNEIDRVVAIDKVVVPLARIGDPLGVARDQSPPELPVDVAVDEKPKVPDQSIFPQIAVIVRDSQGREHRKIALTGVTDGRDIPVVWACREDEWDAALREQREAVGVPWPAKDVRRA